MKLQAGIAFAGLCLAFMSCGTDPLSRVPGHFPKSEMDGEENLWSEQGAKLGERLFNEPLLSKSNTVSCATCHQPAHSFADPGKVLSSLPGQEAPLRHTPALINLAWQTAFFWDGGALNLESVSLSPLIGHREMAQDLKEMVQELGQKENYKKQFKQVFGSDSIVTAYVLKALAQYMRTIQQTQTPYDAYKEGKIQISETRKKGEQIFNQYCAGCHVPPLFTDFKYHNTGFDTLLEGGEFNFRSGRMRISGEESDRGKYKTPSLRNWRYTYPYGHNGQFAGLEPLLKHYTQDLASHNMAPDPLLYTEGKPGLLMNEGDLAALTEFLDLLNERENEE